MSASLVIAPQWIGDAVMTEPLLRRLHARGERLAVGALPRVAPVYRAMPQVDEVIELPFRHGGLQFRERRALGKQLHGRFDTAYVLPNSLKSALLPLLAGIPRRVGYLGESRVGLLTHRLKNPKGKPPMVAFYSALSGEPGIEQDTPRLQLQAGFIAEVLQRHGLAQGGYIVMAPGAEFGPAKRWPHFGELAASLRQPVLLLGSGKESELCEAIRAQSAGDCRNLAGKTSLEEAFALIAGAGSVVSNDSGLMHVAAAFGVQQVALFGSSSPLHTPPLNPQAQVVWLKQAPDYLPPLDCSPCFERECPLGHFRCLVDVTPGRVAQLLPSAAATASPG
ncbi:lipopolysaccharide heptosyltransferase II [Ramlibacter terrae]|uniref:lipopolysaccharide heptosyltransferase II n=1 Tax=Ramlibacter terrae TaxID=2732511 RepID=A0ABX6NZV8_9BURK|nr:lipopolysaccharide heptosyltransferase II [Ramlibacter terrae]